MTQNTQSDQIEIAGFRCAPQQRRWLAGGDARPACAQVIVGLAGQVRPELLEAALIDVVRRHDALRTSFRSVPGLAFPVQILAPRPQIAWRSLAQAMPAVADDAARWLDEIARGERAQLGDPVTVRALYVPAAAALIVSLPAACADAASLGVLICDLARAYGARCGEPAPDDDPVSYLQFAEIQHEQEAAEPDAAERALWARLREPGEPRVRLAHRLPGGSARGELARIAAGGADAAQLAVCSDAAGTTDEAVLLACWQAVVARFADADDLVIGVERDGRGYEDLDAAIGAFATVVPVRARIEPAQPLAELARAAGQVLGVADLAQERIPSDVAHDASWRTLGFALRTWPAPMTAGGVTFALRARHEPRADHELLLVCERAGARVTWTVHHDRSAYAADTAARIAGAFGALVGDALARPAAVIGELAVLTDDERRAVLALAPGPVVAYPQAATLHALVAAQIARTPDAIAVELGGERLSYRELGARAARIAGALRARGVGAEARVGLSADRTINLVPAILGICAAGAAYVPLDPDEPAERVAGMLADVQAEVLLTDAARVAGQPTGAWQIETLEHALDAPPVPLTDDAGGAAAYIIFTSGSTGRPKGVVVEHASLLGYLAWANAELYGDAVDVIPALTRPTFDASLKQLLAPLIRGGTVWLVPGDVAARPHALLDLLATRRRVGLNCVPTVLRGVVEALEREPGHAAARAIVRVLVGGETVSRELVDRAYAALPGADVVNLYGPTEATANASSARLAAGQPVTVGRPIGNTRLYIAGPRGELVPRGVAGELWIGGAGVARGYFGDRERTAARFAADPFVAAPGARIYKTGDRARHTADGQIELLGRIDHQVKIRGFRVEPGEIVAVLEQHPTVREAAVIADADAGGQRRLVGYVAPHAGAAIAIDVLRAFAATRLPDYMVPAVIVALAGLPRHATGKLDYRALPPAGAAVAAVAYVAPASPIEHTLAEIWARVLRRPRIGVHDNFFALGGDSIQSIEATHLASQAGVAVSPRLLFQHQTIAELVRALPAAAGPSAPPALQPDLAARAAAFPMTDLQQAYWIGRGAAFELGSVGPSSYVELEYATIDLARLERAWQALVARHDMLRAVALPGGELQVLTEVPAYRIAELDLSVRDPDSQRHALDAIRDRMAHQVLDPTSWPLFEIRATRLADDHVRIHISRDLLLTDVHSSQLLLRELGQLYDDPGALLPAIGVTFRDCAVAAAAGPSAESLAYWRARLATLPDAPALPQVDPARLAQPARFVGRSASLAPEPWQRLKARARAAGVTPSAVLGAAFADVLACWSGSSRFTLNLMYSDRRPLHPDVGRVVGNFSSTLLLEVDAGGASFADRVRAFQAQLWADLAHADMSGVRVLRERNAGRGGGARAAMPVVFSSVLPVTAPDGDGSDARSIAMPDGLRVVHASVQTPQVMLEAVVHEADGALAIAWNALDARFPGGLIDTMFAAYRGLVIALADDDARWHAATRNLTPAAQLAVYAEVNATAAPLSADLLHAPFLAAARRTPNATAVVAGDIRLSYHELAIRAAALAHRLRADGVTRGELVAVVMPKHWAQIVGVLGVLEAGAAYVPLDPALPAERLAEVIGHAGIRRAVTTHAAAAALAWPAGVDRLAIDDGEWTDVELAAPPPLALADDLAYVIYTSGSTGVPKGVMIDHRGARNTIADLNARFAVTAEDRVLALSSLSFDLSVYDVFGTLAAGGTIEVPGSASAAPDPARWLALLRAERVTVINAVPALVELIAEHAAASGAADLGALRLVLMSGDWIPLGLPARLRALAPAAQLISLGGATEASIWSVIYPIGDVDLGWRSIPYGRPLRNQQVHVLDDALAPCPMWARGMIHLAGSGLARGYLHDEARTRAAFYDCPRTGQRLYRTGDHGRWLPSGDVEILGREDFQVKIQGFRVELAEIEAVLGQHPDVAAAAVVAAGDPRGARRLVATVVAAPGAAVTPEAVQAICAARLPAYMVPPVVVIADALPLTANGKIDRAALAAGDAALRSAPRAMTPPRDALERRLIGLWAEVLGVAELGVEHDFFALGGNSLLALRLAGRVERELGQPLALSVLFGAPTIARLAAALREARAPVAWSPVVRVKAGAGAPVFCVHPVGGNVLCFTELARRLGDRPVYALEARGLEPGEPPLARIPDMAASYVDAVRHVQPAGPYLLAGWSMGALIAFEMAHQLEARGERAVVAMIDPPAPGGDAQPDAGPDEEATILRMFAHDLGRSRGVAAPGAPEVALTGLAPAAAFAAFLADATDRGLLPRELDADRVRRLIDVFRANVGALRCYVPRPRTGPTLLLRAATAAPAGDDGVVLGWRRLARDLVVARIPGDHYAIVREPHVGELARVLEAHMTAMVAEPSERRTGDAR